MIAFVLSAPASASSSPGRPRLPTSSRPSLSERTAPADVRFSCLERKQNEAATGERVPE